MHLSILIKEFFFFAVDCNELQDHISDDETCLVINGHLYDIPSSKDLDIIVEDLLKECIR